MKEHVKVVGFDADDTLWVNETYYRDTEETFAGLLKGYGSEQEILDALFETEMRNLSSYGYGIKSFVLSMIETYLDFSAQDAVPETIGRIIALGKDMLGKPVELLPDVKPVLDALKERYTLIVATKGDLLDQERKLKLSSLSSYFHHIEIMTEKKKENYESLLHHLDIEPSEFLMIGNSLRSDIIPPLELGCYAVHVPYHSTWQYEMDVEPPEAAGSFLKLEKLKQVLDHLE